MRRLTVLLFSLLSAAVARGGALPVEVLVPEGQLHAAEGSMPVVSSLDPVAIRFSLDAPELAIAPDAVPQFDLIVLDDEGKPLQVRRWSSGIDVSGDRVSVIVRFDVPVAASERRRQVAEYVDETIAGSSGEIRGYLIANREHAIAAMEKLFMQNRTGDLRVRVVVRDPRVALAEGEACLRIAGQETFTDRLKRGDAGAALR